MGAPASLKPFVAALEPFDTRVADVFSKWLPRLALLVGPLARKDAGGGDPDGVDGVGRRGPYERLLLSEWAVALEVPDEFLRRAAMSEHLFVELLRRQPHGSLHSLVLVDTGPDQLGAPRLVQLAAAMVGEARANKAKAAFAWGLTSEPARLSAHVTPESVRVVLDSRRTAPLDDGALARWHVAVSQFGRPPAAASGRADRARAHEQGGHDVDVLFVGGAHLEKLVARSAFAGRARVLRIDPLLKGGAVSVALASERPVRTLELALPDDATCVRALRDPFEQEKKSSPVPELDVIPSAGLCIPAGGRRVLVRTVDGVGVLVEPNSPRAPLSPPRIVPIAKHDVVLAAGMVGRRTIIVVREPTGKIVLAFAGGRYPLDGEVHAHLSDGDPLEAHLLPPDEQMRLLSPTGGNPPVDADKTPAPIAGIDGRPRAFADAGRGYGVLPWARRIAELKDDVAVAPIFHRGAAVAVRQSMPRTASVYVGGAAFLEVPAAPRARAFLGALRIGGQIPGALAVERGSGAWTLVCGNTTREIVAGPGDVVGCVQHPAHGGCLVVRDPDERRLAFVGEHGIERHAFASTIAAVAPNLELPQIAVMTVDGTVTILFMKTGVRAVICRGRR